MTVVYEDNHIIIVNKTASEIVQGDKTGDTPLSETVKEYLKEKYQKPGNVFIGVTHRLDRPVSGLVLFAKTSKALERINNMLKNHEIKKIFEYLNLDVLKLTRLAYGSIELGDLPSGKYRKLTIHEVKSLYSLITSVITNCKLG